MAYPATRTGDPTTLSFVQLFRRFMRARLPWAWCTRWWPTGPAVLFVLAASDRVPGWWAVWYIASIAALCMIAFPLWAPARYASTFLGAAGSMGRATFAFFENPRGLLASWVTVGLWTTWALLYATLIALSWWIVVHDPTPHRDRQHEPL